ncbi:MAG TPA: hypothetical protein VH025_10845 [Solirubrobacteraceae bacterium]|nr:hypothetical protein [Solirubrobacteraceae bacterium]
MTRLLHAWRALGVEERFAAGASLALFVSMFLPWYQQNGVAKTGIESRNLDAFQVFSFVEAAVLLVAGALVFMLFARAEGREFSLPGGDGTIVFAAGVWAALLLIFRLFDKPGISHGVAGNVGVQWGIFFALAAAGLVAYAGSRMRAARAHHPTPLLRDDDAPAPRTTRERAGRRTHADPEPRDAASPERAAPAAERRREGSAQPPTDPGTETAVTRAPSEARASAPAPPAPAAPLAPGRSRFPPAPGRDGSTAGQMSFDDAEPERD